MRPRLLAFWATSSDVYVADWDESNAFCNVPRQSCGDLMADDWPGMGDWLQHFYDAFRVHAITPYGPTGSYRMLHGGAQGDSMGVGMHAAVGVRRTQFHLGVLQGGLDPADLTGGAALLPTICFCSPHNPNMYIPETVYSDDRRFFAKSPAGLARMLDVACHGCWASGGAVNTSKLKAFRIQHTRGQLVYVQDTLLCAQGVLPLETSGLAFVGIPLLMGEPPTYRRSSLHRNVQMKQITWAPPCPKRLSMPTFNTPHLAVQSIPLTPPPTVPCASRVPLPTCPHHARNAPTSSRAMNTEHPPHVHDPQSENATATSPAPHPSPPLWSFLEIYCTLQPPLPKPDMLQCAAKRPPPPPHEGRACITPACWRLPATALQKTASRLVRIHRGIHRNQPTYILSLRVALSYGVASLDPVSDALPIDASQLSHVQRALDAALTTALRVPSTVPKTYLYAPIASGGFGVPCLATRCSLRFILGTYRAATSRNDLVRRSVQYLLHRPHLLPAEANDVLTFTALCERWGLRLLYPPCPSLAPTTPTIVSLRPHR